MVPRVGRAHRHYFMLIWQYINIEQFSTNKWLIIRLREEKQILKNKVKVFKSEVRDCSPSTQTNVPRCYFRHSLRAGKATFAILFCFPLPVKAQVSSAFGYFGRRLNVLCHINDHRYGVIALVALSKANEWQALCQDFNTITKTESN